MRLHEDEQLSIVPFGTGRFFYMPTQSGSCRILGYFHWVPPGRGHSTILC